MHWERIGWGTVKTVGDTKTLEKRNEMEVFMRKRGESSRVRAGFTPNGNKTETFWCSEGNWAVVLHFFGG